MSKKRCVTLAAVLLVGVVAHSQDIPLYKNAASRTTLSFDASSLWSYNLYERSRWGAGLKLSLHDSVDISTYIAYGVRDRQWKGGAGLSWTLPWCSNSDVVYLSFARDYYAAASRRLRSSSITDIAGLSSFMSMLMADRIGATIGYRFAVHDFTYNVEARVMRGHLLYDDGGAGLHAVYLVDGNNPTRADVAELRLALTHRKGFTAELLRATQSLRLDGCWRLLLQYDHSFTLGAFDLATFAQGGTNFGSDDLFYCFDLGGTYGSPLWFRNTMVTLRPYEYIANNFLFASLRLQTRRPLYRVWDSLFNIGSNPSPMLGVSAVWGNADGGAMGYAYGHMPRQADLAAVELLVGVDGLVRWGVADYGVAFALCPWTLDGGGMRHVLLFTAALVR